MSKQTKQYWDDILRESYNHYNQELPSSNEPDLIEAMMSAILKLSTMSKDFNQQREELSPEGQQLWDAMMGNLAEIEAKEKIRTNGILKERRQPRPVIVQESEQVQRMRLELKKLQQNSHIVVQDCSKLQLEYVKKEQYFKANECRVVAFCHQNFIDRIQRILDGQNAFEDNTVNSRLEQEINDSTEDRIQIQ